MLVMGIETSCDETSVAVVNEKKEILSNVILSQYKEHQKFKGVVPEIAARAHLEYIEGVARQSLSEAQVKMSDLDAIAATSGPGLIGGVIIGSLFAKTLALGTDKPFIAVNHLQGHALSPRLSADISFPYLLLLTSGGHCQIILVKGVREFELLSTTIDDAAGEALDKVAKMLDIGYPGGPALEKCAKDGCDTAFKFSHPKTQNPLDFSFSGLKSAALREFEKNPNLNKNDLCASFQKIICDVLCERINLALTQTKAERLVVAGGVSANQMLRTNLELTAQKHHAAFFAPALNLCTDNGAMIAWAGLENLRLGYTSPLSFGVRPRWPLTEI
jgi:N6-L-threonylcarbamoyladenine synthase